MRKKIFITSPSFDPLVNVSGISALVYPIVRDYPLDFHHLVVGTPDGQKGVFVRICFLLKSFFSLAVDRFSSSPCKIVHINSAINGLSMVRDMCLVIFSRVLGCKVVFQFHGGCWFTKESPPYWIGFLVRLVCFFSNVVLVLGEEEVLILQDRFRVKRKILFLPNYYDPRLLCATGSVERIPCRIIFLGRLVDSKRAELLPFILSKVLQRVPNASLKICGDGPLRELMLSRFKEIEGNSWEYGGVVFGDDKAKELCRSDFFILPSVSGEGMPVSLLEAMACGCIPIVTDLGAIGSVVSDGVDGFVVSPDDVELFVDVLINAMLREDKDVIRRRVFEKSSNFTLDSYYRSLIGIYSEI